MPVKGVQFRNLEARRYQDSPQRAAQVRVDHNSSLQSAEPQGDGAMVRIAFAFTTGYGALGMVKLEGTLLFESGDRDALLEQWGKDRNLPPAEAQEVHSAILGACIPEAVGLAKGVRLPPPIPIPQVRFGQKGNADARPAPPEGPDAA